MVMKRVLLAISLFTGCANAQEISYTCEDMMFNEGFAPSWPAVINIDFKSGKLSSLELRNKKWTDFTFDSNSTENSNRNRESGTAPIYGDYYNNDNNGPRGLSVSESYDGIKLGDVIFIVENIDNSYYCYRNGSVKAKMMNDLRDSHNHRIIVGK